ncbi:MAG TPA: sigma-54 dependent transcriptional regulator [Vicinamibacterales bacterium]|jgi:transcriptional regulator with PAS, ATPase and Fis domain|nr:sigma-54 dependent transcriptional regulator [Vicinamibacterales bacterium]
MQEPLKLIGNSRAIQRLREDIRAAARTDAKVLITGESGVGKEIVSRLIHAGGPRGTYPLITVNCAAITETLLESELFGHERGSFTGAYRDRVGVLEMAHRGTVFMDEIGETSPRMQSLLLRFLESGEIQRVGATRSNGRVDVRVIAATNRDLLSCVAHKTFREDLYYRLNVIHLTVPPLRERAEDLPLLLEHFIDYFALEYAAPRIRFEPDAWAMLLAYGWPGNVRELKNLMERLTVRSSGDSPPFGVADLPQEIRRTPPPVASAAAAPVRVSIAESLYQQITQDKQSFWTVVYGPFMSRDLTRDDLRTLVGMGLQQTSGSYRVLVELFNMPLGDYKRFLNFLRKHQCHMPFQQFRGGLLRADGQPGTTSLDRDRLIASA